MNASTAGPLLVFAGTYARGADEGIYAYHFYPATGALTPLGCAAETPNPSFLAVSPDRRFLYAVNERGAGRAPGQGAVSAFTVDAAGGRLTFLNQQPAAGAGPCQLVVARDGRHVLVANYTSGSVDVYPVASDGRLMPPSDTVQHHGSSVNPQRQQGPHAHDIALDAANRFAYVADLGLDRVFTCRFDAAHGTLTPGNPPFVRLPPGAGPRHLALSPDGHRVYVVDELDSTLVVFARDPVRGDLTPRQTLSTVPAGFAGTNHPAEVQVSPSGRFLYVSNRGSDTIAVFAIGTADGVLAPLEFVPARGANPRHFTLDPTGRWMLVANENSNTIAVFRVASDGRLTPAAGPPAHAPRPACVCFVRPAAP